MTYTVSFETNSDEVMTVLEALVDYAESRGDEEGREAELAWGMWHRINNAARVELRRDGWMH